MTLTRNGDLYPSIEPYRTGRLPVDDIHTLYWEECGNPMGVPVLFLHGGPGAGCSPEHRRFFDPQYYRIVLFDQRGAGRSTPHGETTNNTTALLVSDIEALRAMLKISTWHVFGGSWGSTLALAYAQTHPQPCLSLTLRGIFLLRACGGRLVSAWDAKLRAAGRGSSLWNFCLSRSGADICNGYWTQLNHELPEIRLAAANSWASYEARSVSLRTNAAAPHARCRGVEPAGVERVCFAVRGGTGTARGSLHALEPVRAR